MRTSCAWAVAVLSTGSWLPAQARAAEPVEPAEVVEPVAAAAEEEDPTQPRPLATFREAVDAAGEEPASRAERALSVSAADLANLQPGVVVERDLGANDRVRLRGLPSAFVATRFAGERMPSPGGIDRTAGLGIIPAEFLSAVRVDTVFSPDSDGDAIAGTFDLVPLSPGTGASGHTTLTLGGTWNTRGEEAQPLGHLVIGGKAGPALSWLAAISAGSESQLVDRLEWDYDEAIERFEGLAFDVDRERSGFLLAADGDLGSATSFGSRVVASEVLEAERRRRVKYDLEGSSIERELKDSRVRKRLALGTFDVARLLGPGHALSARLTHAEASQREPDRVDTSFVADAIDFAAGRASIPVPTNESIAAFELDKIGFENNSAEERTTSGRIDYAGELADNDQGSSRKWDARLRAGLRSIGRNKRQDTTTDLASPLSRVSLEEFLIAGTRRKPGLRGFDVGGMPGMNTAARLFERGLLGVERSLAEEAGDYQASESVFGVYLMTEAVAGDRWRSSLGVRYERARWRYRGVEVDETDSTDAPAIRSILGPESSREDFMPAVSLAGRFGGQLEVRAAWSRTVARPRFYDLVPYRLVDREDEELTLGNPHLRPARSWNQDLEIVYCAGCLAQLGVNLFARQIDDFFFVRRRAAAFEGRTFEVSEPVNGVDGRLAGLESVLTWRGRGPFAVLSGRFAATAANSSARFPDRPQKAVVPGQSDWVLKSLVVFDRGPLSLACAASWSSASLAEVGPEPGEDRYEDERLRLDLSLDWEIRPSGWLAHFGLQNGTDPEDRFVTGPRGRPLRVERSGGDLEVSISRRW